MYGNYFSKNRYSEKTSYTQKPWISKAFSMSIKMYLLILSFIDTLHP